MTIEVADVPAIDCGVVAKELLDIMRQLQRVGYDELVIDAGVLHSEGIAVPDEPDDADYALPAEARRRRVGFH